MTTVESIKYMKRRVEFLQGKLAAGGGTSFEKAECSALEHAIIRLKQMMKVFEFIDTAKIDKDVTIALRDIELAEGRRLKGPLWKANPSKDGDSVVVNENIRSAVEATLGIGKGLDVHAGISPDERKVH
jgi:hypothetical protein